MTVEFHLRYIFIIQIKKISESKKNKSINEKYLYVIVIKNMTFMWQT